MVLVMVLIMVLVITSTALPAPHYRVYLNIAAKLNFLESFSGCVSVSMKVNLVRISLIVSYCAKQLDYKWQLQL